MRICRFRPSPSIHRPFIAHSLSLHCIAVSLTCVLLQNNFCSRSWTASSETLEVNWQKSERSAAMKDETEEETNKMLCHIHTSRPQTERICIFLFVVFGFSPAHSIAFASNVIANAEIPLMPSRITSNFPVFCLVDGSSLSVSRCHKMLCAAHPSHGTNSTWAKFIICMLRALSLPCDRFYFLGKICPESYSRNGKYAVHFHFLHFHRKIFGEGEEVEERGRRENETTFTRDEIGKYVELNVEARNKY